MNQFYEKIPATSKFHILLDKFKSLRITLNFAEVTNKTHGSNDMTHFPQDSYATCWNTYTIQGEFI